MLSALLLLLAQPTVTVKAAKLIDGKGATLTNPVVTVQHGRITSVRAATPGQRVTYDLGSATLLPGLIDVHDHIAWHFNPAGRLHTGNDGETPAQATEAIH